MSLRLIPPPPCRLLSTPKHHHDHNILSPPRIRPSWSPPLSFPFFHRLTPLRSSSSATPSDPSPRPSSVPDEWGEKPEPDSAPEDPTSSSSSTTKFPDSDPPYAESEDEWGGSQNGTAAAAVKKVDFDGDGKKKVDNGELVRCLVDSVYGTELGFRASAELRAEVLELVAQLEAVNPNPNPVEVPGILDGNWVLLYTAFSELLPLLAVGSTPLLKVERISQSIDTSNSTIENLTTLSSPFATFSFGASASFDVRSPSRIQVQFQEGSFKPPEMKSRIDLPTNVDILGQKINLAPVEPLLNPIQEAAANISHTISGLPPLRVPIPGEQTSSWLLITYLDEDLRISRGDGGLFILAREGSPLLQ